MCRFNSDLFTAFDVCTPAKAKDNKKKDYTANGVSEWEIQNSNWAQGVFAKIIDHWASLVAPKMEK